jgi:methionyl-tRNA formyltransferase
MGTPDFALPSLHRLLESHTVVGVVTQPERPAGRGRQVQPSPVHVLAMQHNLPVVTPTTLRDADVLQQLRAWRPNLIVVVAFGMLLPPEVLDLPPGGCLNVHASLLPRWRGAAPVPAAILAGDATTGVTIMKMDVGLDTGPILRQVALDINPDDTQASLGKRLSHLGADLLQEVVPDWLAGGITPRPQDESLATWAPPLEKQDGRIEWGQSAEQIARRVRAFDPWPGTFTEWAGGRLRILQVQVINLPTLATAADTPPGSVIATSNGPIVVTGDGGLILITVQPPGKRPMSGADFARGARGFVGSRLP